MTMKAYMILAASGLLLSPPSYSDEVRCKNPPAELLLLRHGCRESCENDNSPLSSNGEKQAQELVERLGGDNLDAIFVTLKVRTQATASPLAEHKKLKPIQRASTGEAAEKLVDEICAGSYVSKAVLYVGHSETLDDARKRLVPLRPYQKPRCGEGWRITFSAPNRANIEVLQSSIDCEESVTCCKGDPPRAAGQQ